MGSAENGGVSQIGTPPPWDVYDTFPYASYPSANGYRLLPSFYCGYLLISTVLTTITRAEKNLSLVGGSWGGSRCGGWLD